MSPAQSSPCSCRRTPRRPARPPSRSRSPGPARTALPSAGSPPPTPLASQAPGEGGPVEAAYGASPLGTYLGTGLAWPGFQLWRRSGACIRQAQQRPDKERDRFRRVLLKVLLLCRPYRHRDPGSCRDQCRPGRHWRHSRGRGPQTSQAPQFTTTIPARGPDFAGYSDSWLIMMVGRGNPLRREQSWHHAP
jgi:hypothetical protein